MVRDHAADRKSIIIRMVFWVCRTDYSDQSGIQQTVCQWGLEI